MTWFRDVAGKLAGLFGAPPPEAEDPAAPAIEPIPDNELGRRLAQQIGLAEAAYDEMYKSSNPTAAYNDMKESMYEAIHLSRELGLPGRTLQLERTLEHRKSVFRSQM